MGSAGPGGCIGVATWNELRALFTHGMGERGLTYTLEVHPDDVGRVIGRSGRMARALRQVTRAAAATVNVHAFVEIAD